MKTILNIHAFYIRALDGRELAVNTRSGALDSLEHAPCGEWEPLALADVSPEDLALIERRIEFLRGPRVELEEEPPASATIAQYERWLAERRGA